MKKKLVALMVFALMLSVMGCSGEKSVEMPEDTDTSIETSNQTEENEETEDENNTKVTETEEEESHAAVDASGAVSCGEVYQYGDLSYNVIGVRTNEYDDGVKYLILKMEVYNNGSSTVNFTPINTLTVFGEDDVECMVDLFADVDTKLSGEITSGNKIMGEAAFDITDTKSKEYILHVGENYDNYQSAISISETDIDQTFLEQFEGSGVESEYTIGTLVESDQLSVILDSATIEESDKEGKEMLVCNLTVKNNTNETQSFLLGFTVLGAYAADGSSLDAGIDITVPASIEGGETVTGKMPFYTNAGTKDFYMTVRPNLTKMNETMNIVFSAE